MAQQLMESKLVSFHKQDEQIDNILCDIVIDSPSTWDGITIKTKSKKAAMLLDSQGVNIKINHKAINSNIENATFLKNSTITKFTHKMNASVDSYEFEVIPEYVYTFRQKNQRSSDDTSILTFYINDAPLIAPHMRMNSSRKGTLGYQKSQCISINIDNDIKIISDVLFNIIQENNNKRIEFTKYQILQANIKDITCDIEKVRIDYLAKIDKLNDVTSLAHGKKVLCTTWNFNSPEQNVTYHRCDYIKQPDIKLEHHYMIVPKIFMEEFLQKAYDAYVSSPYHENLRLAINILTLEKSFLEQSYLSLFQAYESFLLTFKKINNIEEILPRENFSRVRAAIQKGIDEKSVPNKDDRKKMKSKIGELNRPSLNDISMEFHKEFKTNDSDLWPIFKDGNGVTLSELRNIIIHGEILPPSIMSNIFTAKEHLRLHLFRLIFSILKWDIDKTNVSQQKIISYSNLTDRDFYITNRKELSTCLIELKN